MKSFSRKLKRFLPLCVILLFVFSLVGVNASRQQEQIKRKQPPIEQPKIICKVRSLEIVSTDIKGEDESTAVVEIKIKNNTNKAVIAVVVEVSDGKDRAGKNVNGFHEGDAPPSVVIEPFESISVDFSLSNLRHVKRGTPIKVGGVMFADGSEEGDEDSLGTMRRQREHYKAKKPQQGVRN